MKVWLRIEAEDEPEWGGAYATLRIKAYPSEETARDRGAAQCVIQADVTQLSTGYIGATLAPRKETKLTPDEYVDWMNEWDREYYGPIRIEEARRYQELHDRVKKRQQ